MAKRRMFSISFMESDEFYELSPLTQALYFHLNLNADDDGIVDKVKSVMRYLGATKRNYSTLIDNGYIIELNSRVIAITHWHQHNRIKRDRYTETNYKELIKCLTKDENDRYIKALSAIYGDICAPQDSIGKDSVVKESIVKDSTDKGSVDEDRRREEKEEEKENYLFLHSNNTEEDLKISSESGFAEEPTGAEIDYGKFIAKVKFCYMRRHKSIDCGDFIKYYEDRNWFSNDGESVKDNLEKFVDLWKQ